MRGRYEFGEPLGFQSSVSQCLCDNFEVCVSVLQVRFEVIAFGPLIPRLEEDQAPDTITSGNMPTIQGKAWAISAFNASGTASVCSKRLPPKTARQKLPNGPRPRFRTSVVTRTRARASGGASRRRAEGFGGSARKAEVEESKIVKQHHQMTAQARHAFTMNCSPIPARV